MTLSRKQTPLLSRDVHAMHRICNGIAAKRAQAANTLPAPEGWQPPKRGRVRRALEWFAAQVTGIKDPPLGEACREPSTHLDPL